MANPNDAPYVFTAPCQLTHPNLLVPKAYGKNPKPDAKKSYSVSAVMAPDHPDCKPLKDAILLAAKKQFPGLDIPAEVKAGRFKVPFTSGDKLIEKRKAKLAAVAKEYNGWDDYMAGKVVFKASSDFPAAMGVRVGTTDVDITDENKAVHRDKFYHGVNGLLGVVIHPYDAVGEDGKPGVKLYLSLAFSLNSGVRLKTGTRSAAEAFKGVAGAASNTDPTGGSDEFAEGADEGGESF